MDVELALKVAVQWMFSLKHINKYFILDERTYVYTKNVLKI